MNDFPAFMKNPRNRIAASSQYTDDIEGYVFDGADGSQVAFWTCDHDRVSAAHNHEFDEYVVVIQGKCTVTTGEKPLELVSGDELLIPKGTPQRMAVSAGTRTVHVFGGKRARRAQEGQSQAIDGSSRLAEMVSMDYETFRAIWTAALDDSRLPMIGPYPIETLDSRTLDRRYKVHVEPVGGQDAPPFHVTATLSWRWTALNTSRGIYRDEDTLSEMLGRDQTEDLVTEHPHIRVDIELSATAPYDKPMLMPSAAAWAKWVHETVERLDHIEPLLPAEVVRENRMGMTEVLGWQGDPTVRAQCGPGGELMLEEVEIAAFQMIELPRLLDCPDREDEGPEHQLAALFGRVRASLMAWMQALDHLRGQ